jgi:hypothetical protein
MPPVNSLRAVQARNWLAENVRMTVFPVPGTRPDVAPWWRQVTEEDPETRVSKPATHEHIDEGPFDGGRLRLIVNALGIIQWNILPATPTEVPSEIMQIGPLSDVLPGFQRLAERWLPMAPPLSRIAFGPTVFLPAPGRRESYQLLGELLRASVNIDADRSSELVYRINRPRRSTVIEGLEINRLSTWSALKVSVVVAAVSGGANRLIQESYACRAELDINTAPTFQGTFDPPSAVRIFQELQQLGLEILQQGDIP